MTYTDSWNSKNGSWGLWNILWILTCMLSKLACYDKTTIHLVTNKSEMFFCFCFWHFKLRLTMFLTLTKHSEFYLYVWVSLYHELSEIRKVLHKVYGVNIILRDVQRLQSLQGDLWKCCEVVAGQVQGLNTLHVLQDVSGQIL